ncbi:hypothetical protein AB0B66_11515 [Catellatospora sp. NPDC049111]|uniref:hypothetical protein n=1 Tax=Catellatospora sp. NPDC049111 TaxID=3155271 RepID=UPI0033D4849C
MHERALVSEAVALASAGQPARIQRTPQATYAVGPEGLVAVVEPGDRPDGTAVRERGRLFLTGPFPEEVNALLLASFRERWDEPTVHGFVRLPGGCLPLGPLTHKAGGYDPDEGAVTEYELGLDHPLPFDVLDRVRPVSAAPRTPGTEWLDLLPHAPIDATSAFIADWYADAPAPEHHVPPALALPTPLAAFYRAVGGREELLGRQDRVFPPAGLRRLDDGSVAFGSENQGDFTLTIDPTAADPAVYYLGWADGPVRDPLPLSMFLMMFAVREASFTGPCYASGGVDEDQAQALTRGLRCVPTGGWLLGRDTEFHVGEGLVLQVDRGGRGPHVFLSARHRAHLAPLRAFDVAWHAFAG